MSTMLLYEQDWLERPVHVHNETLNPSFLEYANLLKSMGVRNYKWPLQLHNTELIGIDPHDYSNLSMLQMTMIREEIEINPFYYFREIAKAPGHTRARPRPFRANRGNMTIFWLFFNTITSYLIQIRQTGKSLTLDQLVIVLMNICRQTALINLFTKNDSLRKQNMERLYILESALPWYLTGHNKGDIYNSEEIHWTRMGNRFKGHIPANNPTLANLVGRGFTADTHLIDEAAFLRYIEISLGAMLAGGNDARSQAAAEGSLHGTVLCTTAGKKDDRDGRYIYNRLIRAAQWNEAMLDAVHRDDLVRIIHANGDGESEEVNCSFNHRQLGYTDAWLKKAMRDSMASGEAAMRDYGNIWTDGAQSSPLTIEETKTIRNSEKIPVGHRVKDWPYLIRSFTEIQGIDHYLQTNSTFLGFDPSGAQGRDDCGLVFRNIRNGKVVGGANINETNTIDVGEFIADILIAYPKVTWIPENKYNGISIIDAVCKRLIAANINPFTRIFNLVVQEYEEYPDRYKSIVSVHRPSKDLVNQYRKYFGFPTSGSGDYSRSGLYGSTFFHAVRYTGDSVHDPVLIEQLLSLIKDKHERINHPDGGKDDMVIAWLLSYWPLISGKNLSFYGIDPNEVMRDVVSKKDDETVEDIYEKAYQNSIRLKIDETIELLAKERDPHHIDRYERRLTFLESELSDTERNTLGMANLMENIRQARRRRR